MKEDIYQPFSYLDDGAVEIPEYIRNMTPEEVNKAIEEEERKMDERKKAREQERTHLTSLFN